MYQGDGQARVAIAPVFLGLINHIVKNVVRSKLCTLLASFCLFSYLMASMAQAASVSNLGTVTRLADGLCVGGNVTSFLLSYNKTFNTPDSPFGDHFVAYLVDGTNTVIGSDEERAENGHINVGDTVTVGTNGTPTSGPFRIVFVEDTDTTADFSVGDALTAPAGDILAEITFDANALDDDCPAAAGGGASTTLDNQQSTITSNIITSQTSNFIGGVTDNISSLFSGGGSDPTFTPSNFTSNSTQFSGDFSIQSTGLKRWLKQKQAAYAAKRAKRIQKDYGLTHAGGKETEERKLGAAQAGEELTDEDFVGQYNWWIKGSGTYYDGKGYSYDGTQFDIVSGIDYRLSENMIAGVLLGYGRTDFDTNDSGTDGTFDADGYSVGPYLGVRLDKSLFAEALLVYTRSDYESSAGGTSGTFDADRITAVVNFRGRYELADGMILEPGIGFLYANEKQEAYTDSGGTDHGALTVKAGRVSAGPKVTFAPYALESGKISPWVALKGEYDFSNQKRAAGSTLPDTSDFFSLRAQLGLETQFDDGSKLSIKGDASGLLSDKYIGLGGQVRYDVAF